MTKQTNSDEDDNKWIKTIIGIVVIGLFCLFTGVVGQKLSNKSTLEKPCLGALVSGKSTLTTQPLFTKPQTFLIEEVKDEVVNKEDGVITEPLDEVIKDVINCESRGNPNLVGDLGLKYKAYGILQFQIRTFNSLSELSGLYGSIDNSDDQIKLFKWAIANGYGRYWYNCYYKKYGTTRG
jgi:hypothetical protein